MYPFIATFIINFCTRTRHEQLLPARTHASPQHTYTHSHAVHLIIRLPALILSHNNQRMMRWEDLSLFVYQRSNKLSINFYYYFFFFFVSFLSPHLLQLLSRNDDDEPATWLFTLIFFSSLRIDTFAIFDYINSFESNHRWHLVHRSINRIFKIRIQNERKFFWKKRKKTLGCTANDVEKMETTKRAKVANANSPISCFKGTKPLFYHCLPCVCARAPAVCVRVPPCCNKFDVSLLQLILFACASLFSTTAIWRAWDGCQQIFIISSSSSSSSITSDNEYDELNTMIIITNIPFHRTHGKSLGWHCSRILKMCGTMHEMFGHIKI